jgi:hypothetical protein
MAVYLSQDDNVSKLPVNKSLAAAYPVIPLRIFTEKSGKIPIDRIKDIRRQASTKAGGLGNRYTCLVTTGDIQREIYLYKDEDEWFL